MLPTYNHANIAGCGCLDADDTGLTAWGRKPIWKNERGCDGARRIALQPTHRPGDLFLGPNTPTLEADVGAVLGANFRRVAEQTWLSEHDEGS